MIRTQVGQLLQVYLFSYHLVDIITKLQLVMNNTKLLVKKRQNKKSFINLRIKSILVVLI